MAGFADAFSAENVGKLMNDPRLMLGLSLMAQGRQGSGAQALGQAGLPAVQMIHQQQHAQQLQQYRQAQIQQAEQQRAFQMQQAQAKEDTAQRQQQALQDPNFRGSLGGLAKTLAELGMPLDDVLKAQSGYQLQQHRDASLAQAQAHFEQTQANRSTGSSGAEHGPKMPTPRMTLDEPLGNGMIQRHKFDSTTGDYVPYGQPFSQYAPPKSGAISDLLDEVTPAPDLSALPGNAPLSSYAPNPQGAELLMHSAGSNPTARQPTAPASAQGPAAPRTKEEYAALPPGAQYIDPVSGRVATKKAR